MVHNIFFSPCAVLCHNFVILCVVFCFIGSVLTQVLWHKDSHFLVVEPYLLNMSFQMSLISRSEFYTNVMAVRLQKYCTAVSLFFFPKISGLATGLTQPSGQWYYSAISRMRWPQREVDHLLPSTAEVSFEWSYTATCTPCRLRMDWATLKLFICLIKHPTLETPGKALVTSTLEGYEW